MITAAHAPSYYAAAAATGAAGTAPAAPPLAGTHHTDVCIVGGGFSGLSVALHLAAAGTRVTLLEKNLLGWGASGRNGGQVHVGMRRDQPWLEKHLGDDAAKALWSLALDARAHLDWLMHDRGIACDYRPGLLHADHKPRYVADSRHLVQHMQSKYAYDSLRFVGKDEIRARIATTNYHGGSLDSRGGHLDPLQLAHGIAALAAAAGASLHANTPAVKITRQAGKWHVRTPHGEVHADTVVIACNGYLDGLVPAIDARVMPINNFIAVTEPLGAATAAALIPHNEAVSDSRFVVYYFRRTPDQRLLFGGGENYTSRFPADIAGFVRRHIARIFPQLAQTPIAHAWGGTLAVTPNRLPFVRELEPGLITLGGYSGLGVVLAPYFGKLVAERITAGRSFGFDRLAALPVPRFPGGRLLRWPTLVAAMSMFALRDRI